MQLFPHGIRSGELHAGGKKLADVSITSVHLKEPAHERTVVPLPKEVHGTVEITYLDTQAFMQMAGWSPFTGWARLKAWKVPGGQDVRVLLHDGAQFLVTAMTFIDLVRGYNQRTFVPDRARRIGSLPDEAELEEQAKRELEAIDWIVAEVRKVGSPCPAPPTEGPV